METLHMLNFHDYQINHITFRCLKDWIGEETGRENKESTQTWSNKTFTRPKKNKESKGTSWTGNCKEKATWNLFACFVPTLWYCYIIMGEMVSWHNQHYITLHYIFFFFTNFSGDNLREDGRWGGHTALTTQKGSGKQNSKLGICHWKSVSSDSQREKLVEVDLENAG